MKYFILILIMLLTTCIFSQTASSLDPSTIVQRDGVESTISLGNPWLESGAKLAYAINSDADFKDNLLFNVRFRKNLYQSTSFNLPLVSNIGISDWTKILDETAILTDAGASIGLYPYFIISKNNIGIVPHFELSAKIVPGESIEASRKRWKMAANLEIQLDRAGRKSSLSIGTFYSSNNNMSPNNNFGLDFTGLLSLDQNSALLIDYKKIFTGSGILSLGVVIKTL
jgi:hypothetical protein